MTEKVARPIICPVCGGENAHDAVFCANPACHKALGDFKYVAEELRAEMRWHESVAERVTGFIGKPHFLLVHCIWLVVWVIVNTGVVMMLRRFDAYPFGLLSLLLAIEAIFLTGFLLISQNRQNAHSDKRAELDYEVNVRTYREIEDVKNSLHNLEEKLQTLETLLREKDGR